MGCSLVAQLVKNLSAMQETPVWFLVGKIHRKRDRLPTLVFLGFPGGSSGKESTCNVRDLGSIPGFDPWVGKISWRRELLPTRVLWPEEFHGCIVHGVAKSWTRLSGFYLNRWHDLIYRKFSLSLTHIHIRVAEYKINTLKLVAHLYANNWTTWKGN